MGIEQILEVALLLVVLVVVFLAVRRFSLVRAGGVNVALRRVRGSSGSSTRGWNLGVARYRADEFAWFRVISLGRRADVTLRRDELEITDRRRPGSAEVPVVPTDATVLRCRDSRRTVELAMSADVLTGFLSWVEATPPGRYGFRRAS